MRLAAFQNSEFYKRQALRVSTLGEPRVIARSIDEGDHLVLPRGCLEDVYALLADMNRAFTIVDHRNVGPALRVNFRGILRDEQKIAAEAMLAHDIGILSAPTGFGKTAIAAWLIAARQVATLVVVNRRELQEQWIERLESFLDIKVGRISGGHNRPIGVDVALIQSLVRRGAEVAHYAYLIVDECHHLPAHSFERVVHQAKAKYVSGLSATVTRKDGRHPIIQMQCGPVRYHVKLKFWQLILNGQFSSGLPLFNRFGPMPMRAFSSAISARNWWLMKRAIGSSSKISSMRSQRTGSQW